MKVIVIGGVAAGTKAAAKLKREDRSAEVILFNAGKNISYAGCGLPYYVGGVIEHQEELIVNTPEKYEALTGVKVYCEHEAVSVNKEKKTVSVKNLVTNEISEHAYDQLVIATGASPIRPKIPGIDLENVFFMRTPQDAIQLRKAIQNEDIKRAVIVGGGYIGLEVAENLSAQGIRCMVIDMAEHVLPGFDPEMCEYVENHLADHQIMCLTNTKLEAIEGDGKVEKVKTSKRPLKADLVVMSVGITPNTAFLKDCGLEFASNGALLVNEKMQTNDPNIYAAGDCVLVKHRITQERTYSPMGSSANMEGRLLAQNIMGKNQNYPGVLSTAVCKLPELNTGRCGLSEKAAKEAGFDPISVISVLDDKAHYYPDSAMFIIKIIADKITHQLLGVQVLGKGAVDKIVDVAVVAMSLKAKLEDLENMDLAYAPPFSTAIHPFVTSVNILLNKIKGDYETMTPYQYANGESEGYRVIDTSNAPMIEGAYYIDLVDVNGPIPGIQQDEKILIVCNRGRKAYLLQNRLKSYGYTHTRVLEGGVTFNDIEHA